MKTAHAMLRELTRDAHLKLETATGVGTPKFDFNVYCDFLDVMYQCHSPAEESLMSSPAYVKAVPDVEHRKRAEFAALDLEQLGRERPQFRSDDALPNMDTLSEQLGVAYVFEGSTLGGQVLVRRLVDNHGVSRAATRYLAGYGSQTGKRWRDFTNALDQQLNNDAAIESAVRSATATFEFLLTGFEQLQTQP